MHYRGCSFLKAPSADFFDGVNVLSAAADCLVKDKRTRQDRLRAAYLDRVRGQNDTSIKPRVHGISRFVQHNNG